VYGKEKIKAVRITGIDAVTDINAVMDTITLEHPDNLTIRPLRPTRNGGQLAEVLLEEDDARRLLTLNKIRIGLCVCYVQERVDFEKCYRC
jgi:hypothetical protein